MSNSTVKIALGRAVTVPTYVNVPNYTKLYLTVAKYTNCTHGT